ncbi:MAG: 50S ribosomal protein L22 [Pseudomonadota bacterium]
MGKKSHPRRESENEASTVLRSLRVSPRKLNLVAREIRGLNCAHALSKLNFMRRRIAIDVRKALQTVIANAENNHSLDVDRLVVKEAYVGKSLVMKRFRPRAKGRAGRIKKYFSNLTLIVKEREDQ